MRPGPENGAWNQLPGAFGEFGGPGRRPIIKETGLSEKQVQRRWWPEAKRVHSFGRSVTPCMILLGHVKNLLLMNRSLCDDPKTIESDHIAWATQFDLVWRCGGYVLVEF